MAAARTTMPTPRPTKPRVVCFAVANVPLAMCPGKKEGSEWADIERYMMPATRATTPTTKRMPEKNARLLPPMGRNPTRGDGAGGASTLLAIGGDGGGLAAAQPEEPVRHEQVGDDCDVHDEGGDLERCDRRRELVDLEGDEQACLDRGEVLAPPPRPPEADGLDRLEGGVGGHDHSDDIEGRRLQLEEAVEVADDERVAAGRTACAALQRGEHLDVVVVEQAAVLGEQEDSERQSGEEDEVERPVEHDEAEHVAVPQPPALDRRLDRGRVRREGHRRLVRRREADPCVAAQAAVPAPAVVLAHPHRVGVDVADLGCPDADELVGLESAGDQLVVDVRAETVVLSRAGRRVPRVGDGRRRRGAAIARLRHLAGAAHRVSALAWRTPRGSQPAPGGPVAGSSVAADATCRLAMGPRP